MAVKLRIIVDVEYPEDMDLTAYEDCDTVFDAAILDRELLEADEASLEMFIDSDRSNIHYEVVIEDEQ